MLKPGGLFQSSFFTDRISGYKSGRMVEPNSFTDVPFGPLAGTGLATIFDRQSVEQLFADFTDFAIERVSWTLEQEKHFIEQFVINCRKAV